MPTFSTAVQRATLAGLLALGAGAALAQTPPATNPPAANPPAGANPPAPAAQTTTGGGSEYHLAMAAKTSLAQALATAESKDGQGRAIDADFEKAGSDMAARWEIKVVYPDGRLVEHFIDADTGSLIKSENQPFERYFTRLKVSDFQNAPTALKDALAIAEQKAGGGKAYEAEVEREGDTVAYEISVALPDRSREVKIGPDGKVIGD